MAIDLQLCMFKISSSKLANIFCPSFPPAVFREGDKGDSWYVILRGSVNVSIQGKGVVCSPHEGQEFGKLAVANEAVRYVHMP